MTCINIIFINFITFTLLNVPITWPPHIVIPEIYALLCHDTKTGSQHCSTIILPCGFGRLHRSLPEEQCLFAHFIVIDDPPIDHRVVSTEAQCSLRTEMDERSQNGSLMTRCHNSTSGRVCCEFIIMFIMFIFLSVCFRSVCVLNCNNSKCEIM